MQLLRNVAWTTSNLARGKPQPEWHLISPLLPAVCKLIQTTADAEVLSDLAWSLSYLSEDLTPARERLTLLIATGVLRRVVQLLGHSEPQVVLPALRTLGNVVSETERMQPTHVQQIPPCIPELDFNPEGVHSGCFFVSVCARR